MHEINPYKLKISQLRALIAVAECNNFSEAALRLEFSQIGSQLCHYQFGGGVRSGVAPAGRHGARLTVDRT